MRSRIVPAEEINTKTLRAQDYVYDPHRTAHELLDAWSNQYDPHKIIKMSSPGLDALRLMIETGLAHAYRRGSHDGAKGHNDE